MSAARGTPLAVGDELGPLELPAIDRSTLLRFADASGDDNAVHIDRDAARDAGMDDVFAHGMLSMAYLANLLVASVPATSLRSFGVRFAAITPLHARPHCRGVVTAVEDDVASADLTVTIDDGTATLVGYATFDVARTHPSDGHDGRHGGGGQATT